MNSWFVYAIVHKETGRYYIGKTNDPKRRWSEHKQQPRHARAKHCYISKSIAKYGIAAFEFVILSSLESESDAFEFERSLIHLLRSNVRGVGFNLTSGGEGMSGHRHSDETKAKIAAKALGHKRNVGRKHSEETKEKIRAGNIGIKRSEQWRINNSNSKKGKRLSEEHREKLRIARRKRGPFSEETRRKIAIAAKERWARWKSEGMVK